jgi:uncharacterized protein (TIGR02452 family)
MHHIGLNIGPGAHRPSRARIAPLPFQPSSDRSPILPIAMENQPELARCLLDAVPQLRQQVADLKALRVQLYTQNEAFEALNRSLPSDGITSDSLAISTYSSLALTATSHVLTPSSALATLSKILTAALKTLTNTSTVLKPTPEPLATMENLSATMFELNAEAGDNMSRIIEAVERSTTVGEVRAIKDGLAAFQTKIDYVNENVSMIQEKMNDLENILQGFKGTLAEMQVGIDKMNVTMSNYLPAQYYTREQAMVPVLNDPRQANAPSFNNASTSAGVANPQVAHITRRNVALAAVAAETKSLLPAVLSQLPNAAPNGILYCADHKLGNHIPKLDGRYGPKHQGVAIQVVNMDTIDAALGLTQACIGNTTDMRPVCILNLASERRAGGGWLKGALAQEEALCYRTSLSFTLKIRYYPIPELGGIYSPSVVVIRESLADGHKLLDLNKPAALPILSAISVAALRNPALTNDVPPRYAYLDDRETMKEKMRNVLRIAVSHGHQRLILGALGCGAFGNPAGEVAACWAEVFGEEEFAVGWFEKVVFAVLEDGRVMGNFGVFDEVLGGLEL